MFYRLFKNPILLIKQLVFIFFIYMILEGVLRKWVFPNYSFQIYLLKDFLLIIIYILAFKYKLLWKSKLSKFFISFAVLFTIPSLFIYELNYNGILLFLLGTRSYWLYMPLAFIVAHSFTYSDVISFCKKNIYFIIPLFFLTLLQTYHPPESIINSGYFSAVMTAERPSGTFTYTTQNTIFYSFLVSCYYVWFLDKKNFPIKNIVSVIFIIFFLCSILILLKSRALYIYSLFISIASCLFIFDLKDKKIFYLRNKKLAIIIIITPIIYFTTTKLFSSQYNYSKEKINKDDTTSNLTEFYENQKLKLLCENYSSLCRIFNDIFFIVHIPNNLHEASGIGAGTTAVTTITGNKKLFLGENENQRIMNELGRIPGLFFVASKYIFLFLFLIFFLRKNKYAKILMPILAFFSVQILIGPITYTTSFINYIFWMCFGLLLSSYKEKNSLSKVKR
jgi:hypothetical protein